MKKIRFIRYGVSESLNRLCDGLKEKGHNVLKQKLRGSNWKGCSSHIIFNWGLSHRGTVNPRLKIWNDPEAVSIAVSKTKTFLRLLDADMFPHIPEFTIDIEEASRWIREEGATVFCRTIDNSCQGRGIIIANEVNDLVHAPLYTKKLPSIEREVRVHVLGNQVIDFSQKKRMGSERLADEEITLNDSVRNHENGWVFARIGVEIDPLTKATAVMAVDKLGLDFGAVDIAISDGTPIVLEVNTAPGLSGTTLERYVEAINNFVNDPFLRRV